MNDSNLKKIVRNNLRKMLEEQGTGDFDYAHVSDASPTEDTFEIGLEEDNDEESDDEENEQ